MLSFEEIEDCIPAGGGTTDVGSVIVSAQWLHDFAHAVAARERVACISESITAATFAVSRANGLQPNDAGQLAAYRNGWSHGAQYVADRMAKRSNAGAERAP